MIQGSVRYKALRRTEASAVAFGLSALLFVGCGASTGSAPAAGASAGTTDVAAGSTASPSPRRTAQPSAAPTATPEPTPSPSPTPEPTPSPTPMPSFAVPTQGPPDANGIRPPLPPIGIPGADPKVIEAIERSVQRLDDLESYRFATGMTGRNIVDISQGGLNLAMRGLVDGPHAQRVDLRLTVELVEFDGAASTSSTVRVVSIGADAWAIASGRAPEPIPPDRPSYRIMDLLLPRGLAERLVVPFAGGFERADRVTLDGVPAVRYEASATGLAAYAAACSLDDMRKAELWIAEEGGHLLAVDIVGRSRGETGWFVTRIELSDVNDPDIEVESPV